jgi:predicted ATPase
MIQKIAIKNFKSHKQTNIELSKLTVLCGSNGVGKSSAIHPLLLLRDSYLRNSSFDFLDLKSDSIRIGTVKDALYQFSDTDGFEFNIITDNQGFNFSFAYKGASEILKTLIRKDDKVDHNFDKLDIIKESLFNTDFQFISAARLGPQLSYSKDDVVVDIHKQISVDEGKAEYCIHFLEKYKTHTVIPPLRNPNLKFGDLLSQTIAWEREISEGVNIIIEDLGSLGFELKYKFDTQSGIGKTDEFKATNVGFGVTYVMPIIVAILSAKPDALLLIENPEAHLHPNGIAKLTELICLASQAGIQIILETHSDHIINGILVQCKKFEENGKGISKDNVSIYQFDRDEVEHCTRATKITLEDDGKIRYPPKGFFDQFTIDRKFLMGF